MRTRLACLLVAALAGLVSSQHMPLKAKSPVKDIRIECKSNDIVVSIFTNSIFNGMVYPQGLSKNSSCMAEYISHASPVQYRLSLRSCNTMGVAQEEGIEYFNTVVVQPHRKLVTNQGRGFHVRCKYQTRDKARANNVSLSELDGTALAQQAALPVVSMRIFSEASKQKQKQQAEVVRIGDPLTLEVAIEEQSTYGLRVVNCDVRDGLGWGQQPLINEHGCPVDQEIMGTFSYSDSKTRATANFQAHKFPYTASVYYQCNVRLCLKHSGGCDDLPPMCEDGENLRRRRRELSNATVTGVETEQDQERTIEIFTGLMVNEGDEVPEDGDGPTQEERNDEDLLCISPRTFAIVIAIVGLLLMIAVIVAILVLISRRRRRKDVSATGSSIYSGPYTNTAYSHSS